MIAAQVRAITATRVALALSGGIDSTGLLIALRAAGKEVDALTFRLAGTEPGDWTRARTSAATFGATFVDVELPTDQDVLAADVRALVRFGLRKKTAIECLWPMTYVIAASVERRHSVLVVGSCADGHFGISKKAMMHYRQTVAGLDAFRARLFSDPDYAQVASLSRFASARGVEVVVPYRCQTIIDAFRGLRWESINKPRQKEPIWAAFPEAARANVFRQHVNLQLGDSGIAAHFRTLLRIVPGAKSPVAVYNKMAREEAEGFDFDREGKTNE